MNDTSNDTANVYTSIVYMHPAFSVINNNNFKSVTAANDIKTGEIILIEHVFKNTTEICTLLIRENDHLFNSLYPREINLGTMDNETKTKIALNKLNLNCFEFDREHTAFGQEISNINHHCNANCVVVFYTNSINEKIDVSYFILYAIRNITKGSELHIIYNTERGHCAESDFQCNCGKSLEERNMLINLIFKMAKSFHRLKVSTFSEIIREYESSEIARRNIFYQYMVSIGYVKNDLNSYYSPSLIKHIEEHYMNSISKETFDDALQKFVEGQVEYVMSSLCFYLKNRK